MNRDQMLLRFGFYCGLIGRLLHDNSFADRWWGKAQEITEEDYIRETGEIARRLVAAGFLRPEEDPFESEWNG